MHPSRPSQGNLSRRPLARIYHMQAPRETGYALLPTTPNQRILFIARAWRQLTGSHPATTQAEARVAMKPAQIYFNRFHPSSSSPTKSRTPNETRGSNRVSRAHTEREAAPKEAPANICSLLSTNDLTHPFPPPHLSSPLHRACADKCSRAPASCVRVVYITASMIEATVQPHSPKAAPISRCLIS